MHYPGNALVRYFVLDGWLITIRNYSDLPHEERGSLRSLRIIPFANRCPISTIRPRRSKTSAKGAMIRNCKGKRNDECEVKWPSA
jgi:hypothetical protein